MKYISSSQKNNFDLIRLILAITVFIVHTAILTELPVYNHIASFLNSSIAVYAFFIVSGFLIFMSYDNNTLIKSFFKKRFLRIFPGYAFVIISVSLSAFILSTYSPIDYFSYDWLRYIFFNLITVNFLQPTLPGVFSENPLDAVNGALWTIKVEVMFYATVPLIGLLFRKYNTATILIILYILSIIYYESTMYMGGHTNKAVYFLLAKQLPGQLAFFVSGALLYYYFDHFKRYAMPYLISSIFFFILYKYYNIWVFFPFSLAFIIVYTATIFKYIGNFGKYGDFSFGIYIWHFPIIQTFVHYNLLVTYPILGSISLLLTVLIFAVLSWKFIEKPFLRKQSHYMLVEADKQ